MRDLIDRQKKKIIADYEKTAEKTKIVGGETIVWMSKVSSKYYITEHNLKKNLLGLKGTEVN